MQSPQQKNVQPPKDRDAQKSPEYDAHSSANEKRKKQSPLRGGSKGSSKNGNGLGLPIIKKMTELKGAKITAESSEKKGTQFTVCFEGIS